MDAGGLVVADERVPDFDCGARVLRLDLAGVDRNGLVSVGLGALLASRPLLSLEAVDWAAQQRFGAGVAPEVARLFRAGAALID
jgi:hypothetical protein